MIVVAHRLNTVINSDKILVLDKGKNVEFDSPKELMNKSDSIFNKYL